MIQLSFRDFVASQVPDDRIQVLQQAADFRKVSGGKTSGASLHLQNRLDRPAVFIALVWSRTKLTGVPRWAKATTVKRTTRRTRSQSKTKRMSKLLLRSSSQSASSRLLRVNCSTPIVNWIKQRMPHPVQGCADDRTIRRSIGWPSNDASCVAFAD